MDSIQQVPTRQAHRKRYNIYSGISTGSNKGRGRERNRQSNHVNLKACHASGIAFSHLAKIYRYSYIANKTYSNINDCATAKSIEQKKEAAPA
ncbi:MAG TPA: hypothetical protein ENL07_02150 [Chlorobaculum parvum]|uniref:Uncharacterized protein n=1 Tax=Chlorobaculum parvum TaxID=274539 RepID=A0A7C5DJI1_9CHLB|nr:hypothetical protein [Chlorobaculum parvum]